MILNLLILVVLSVACNWPVYLMLTAETRYARLRAPAPISDFIPYLEPDHIGLT